MTNWTTTVTNKGIALQSKQVRGATLSFTRVVGGSGSVSLVVLKEQTEVSNIKQTISIESIRVLDAKYTITVLLSNSNSNSGYNLSQIGFYATDPDEGEILFAIAQADTPEFIPSKDEAEGFCLEFAFTFQNSNNSTIEITPDPAGYMTREGVDDVVFEAKKDLTISGKESGNPITINDSTDAPLADLSIFGASEQLTTTGKNLLDVDEYLSISDVLGIDVNIPAGTYKISIQKETHDGENYPYIRFTDNNVWILLAVVRGEQIVELTQDETKVYLYTNGMNAAASKDVKATIDRIMLSVDGGEYEPYTGGKPGPNPDYPLEIESVGDGGNVTVRTFLRNFVNPEKITIGSNDSLNISDDGYEITVIGSVGYANSKCWFPISFAGKTIIVKYDSAEWENMGSNSTVAQLIYKSEGTTKYLPLTKTTSTQLVKDIPEDATDLYVSLCTNNTSSGLTTPAKLTIKGLMVCVYDENTDMSWSPYKATTAIIPLTEPLRGIPVSSGGNYTDASGQQWICDEIDLARGLYIQRIKSIELSGSNSEVWFLYNPNEEEGISFYVGINGAIRGYKLSLCDKFQNVSMAWSTQYIDTYGIYSDHPEGKYKYFRPPNADVTTLETWKEWLASNPIKLVYVVAEPIETPLTDEQLRALQSLQTFESTTNIFSSELANVDVEYYKNTDNGRAIGKVKQENVELRALIGDINSVLESLIG